MKLNCITAGQVFGSTATSVRFMLFVRRQPNTHAQTAPYLYSDPWNRSRPERTVPKRFQGHLDRARQRRYAARVRRLRQRRGNARRSQCVGTREHGGTSVLHPARNQWTSLRELSSANLWDERLDLRPSSTLAFDRREGSGVRGVRRSELPRAASGKGKLAFAAAQTRPIPYSTVVAAQERPR